MNKIQRRAFMTATAGGLGLGSILNGLAPLSAEETKLDGGIAQFSSDIEPLVRFLEQTPRDRLIEETAARVKHGLSYRELLAALLLAGVRNVQPRPSVGFKFHAVLVVNSAHVASISGADQDRWLPIFWALDNFKSSQARDISEGDWTLPPVDEAAVPPAHRANQALVDALDRWDESAADAAITGVVRNFGANHVFNQLAGYAARDFRSIGHKAIYLSNGFRTLRTIGWNYAQPVLRSLVYAMLNHVGDPNPANSDLPADRPGRTNREWLAKIPAGWTEGKVSDDATVDLLQTIRQATPGEASAKVVEQLQGGVALQSIWDALFAAAAELMMRQRGIVSLHAVTSTNALHHAFRTAADETTRKFLLLQNASFLPMFREAARSRGELADRSIDTLTAAEQDKAAENRLSEIFQTMGSDRPQAAQRLFGYLNGGGDSRDVINHARRLVFLKGNDSHDYKFSSAALEDYWAISPRWRDRFLAAAAYQLRAESEPTRGLAKRIQQAIS
jgi:hypothetical protein